MNPLGHFSTTFLVLLVEAFDLSCDDIYVGELPIGDGDTMSVFATLKELKQEINQRHKG